MDVIHEISMRKNILMNKNNKRSVAVLQPEVPHYREEFFDLLRQECGGLDLYVYNSFDDTRKNGFDINTDNLSHIPNKQFKGFLLYDPRALLGKRHDVLVLMLHFAHLTTWLLLLTKFVHRKKIILWGQGISVKRYLKEEHRPDWKLRLQMALADGVWLYMRKELRQWKGIFPNKRMVSLDNTLSGVEEMLAFHGDKAALRDKYGIKERTIFIFCARFESNYRRTDLLVEAMDRLDSRNFGFIIIGAGKNKPDFSRFDNVYDFGAVYDTSVKRELFAVADAYFQPGWVGLSIVEAMAYGLPVFTFRRSEQTKQCVEYSYIEPGRNGMIFSDMDECLSVVNSISGEDIRRLGDNAKALVRESLTPRLMARKAFSVIEQL